MMQIRYRLAAIASVFTLSALLSGVEANNTSDVNVQAYYQSVQVQTLPDGNYQVEINYHDQAGGEGSFHYQGSKEQITAQIQQQQDLPEDKKQALLRGLNMNKGNLFDEPFFEDGWMNQF